MVHLITSDSAFADSRNLETARAPDALTVEVPAVPDEADVGSTEPIRPYANCPRFADPHQPIL